MGDKFYIKIESMHMNDRGETENVGANILRKNTTLRHW